MDPIDLQSDQFMTLLSEALRAGPGTPQWHQVVTALRASGATGADELQLLVQAREDLENGKQYRAVAPGPGFTRKVMTAIDEEGAPGTTWLPSANMLALLAAGVILVVVVVVALVLVNKTPDPNRAQIDQLRSLYFVNPMLSLAGEVPPEQAADWKPGAEWKTLGEVPLKAGPQGLRPASTQPSADKREYRVGVIATADPIPAEQPILLDVNFRIARAGDAIVPEVLISDEPLSLEGKSAHELVWLLKGGQPIVQLPDGALVRGDKIQFKPPQTLPVKIRLNRDAIIVESGDKRLYEGRNQLAPDKPRYVGVRFLRKVGDGSDGVWLSSVQVLKP